MAPYLQHETGFLQADIMDHSNGKDAQDSNDFGICYPATDDPNCPWEHIECDTTPFYTELDDLNHGWENMIVATDILKNA